MQKNFGVGLLSLTPSGANPTPLQCGVLKDVSIDYASTMKELVGQYRAPVDVALAEFKLTGKAKFAQIRGGIIAQVMSGATITNGSTAGAINEPAAVPGSGPFTVTVAHAATFVEDLNVVDAITGLNMTRVASSPATGQYAVNTATGVYTFAGADTGHAVWISYSYTTTSGKTVAFNNQLMGQATTFTLTLFNSYATYQYGIKLFAVVVPKLSLSLKNVDYTEQDLDFTSFANIGGQIFEEYTTE